MPAEEMLRILWALLEEADNSCSQEPEFLSGMQFVLETGQRMLDVAKEGQAAPTVAVPA
jgi:hypothetical protein